MRGVRQAIHYSVQPTAQWDCSLSHVTGDSPSTPRRVRCYRIYSLRGPVHRGRRCLEQDSCGIRVSVRSSARSPVAQSV